jgi:hypothetical protein
VRAFRGERRAPRRQHPGDGHVPGPGRRGSAREWSGWPMC